MGRYSKEDKDKDEEEGRADDLEEEMDEDDEEEEGRHCSFSQILLYLAAKHNHAYALADIYGPKRDTRPLPLRLQPPSPPLPLYHSATM